MRADSAATVLAACLPVGLCDAIDPAPRCAVNCASNIRNEKGALGLKTICGDKLMTNSLFQCLIGSCPQDAYGPAVAHVVLSCSNLGMSVGPLHPVEVHHVNLEKPQYLPTPSAPAAYSTPGDASQPGSEHLTLAFDLSIDLKCNSGSDGLVTVSLPPLTPSTSTTSPAPPSSVPNPGTGEGEGEGNSGNGNGENGNGENGNGENGNGENGNGDNGNGENGNATPSSPVKQIQTPVDPTAKSSCPPGFTTPIAQGPGDGQAHSQSTGLGEHGDPAVTSVPSASPGGVNPSSPASTSPCSTASQDTGGLDPQDPNHSGLSSNPTGESSHLSNGGSRPQASATTSIVLPTPVSPNPAPASSTCSTKDDTEMSVDPVPGPQVSPTTEPAAVVQPSPLLSHPSPSAATSVAAQVPASTIHPIPPSPPSSAEPADLSSTNPPEYAHAGSGSPSPSKGSSSEQYPDEGSAFETSLPESSTGPLPQEGHGSGAQAPSYGQGSLTSRALASQTDALAAGTVKSKLTGKTAEPSEITLWPTAKSNHTSSKTSPAGRSGPSTTTCESGGKGTVTTAHTPKSHSTPPSDSVGDAPPVSDTQQHKSIGSVMVKIIRPGEAGAETMFMTVWEPSPLATPAPTDGGIGENEHATVAHLAIGSSLKIESEAGSGHDVEPSSFAAQSSFVTSRPTTTGDSVQSDDAVAETSLPKVALVNSVSKPTPSLCITALLIILVSGILMR
ncbi:hypothetical protein V8C42DRAFT_363352 [Trichoderma barbatum]